jgi:hypothetical protein
MANALPIPPEQFFYADTFYNPQTMPIAPLIDYVHYLGSGRVGKRCAKT